jgi:integrase/recombinase XerD
VSNELVQVSPVRVPASGNAATLPELVERAGGAARFAWDECFYAEHHNPRTQKAYERAVRRFLGWAEAHGIKLAAIAPGMVGQYLAALRGSPAKRNQHLAALRGFFDRLVNRHVCVLNPPLSVKGVKGQVIEGKTPEIGVERAGNCWSRWIRRTSRVCVTVRFSPRWPIPPAMDREKSRRSALFDSAIVAVTSATL